MSKYEWFPQVSQDKWANERIARLFWASHSFSLSLRKNEWFNKKIKKIVFFVHFLQLFWNFLKKKKIRSFLLSKVRELLRSLRTNEWPWAICSGHSEGMSNHERIAQVAHQKFSKWVNHSLFEQIAHSLIHSEIRWANSQPRKARNEEKFKNNLLDKNSFCHFLKTKYTTELNFLFSLCIVLWYIRKVSANFPKNLLSWIWT